ncbi:MAG: hypothetical protein IKO72_12470 [Kiritimatiellae bacterium]|nr:hypothetical protein [Kiritimatiellia bacterium]
MKHSKDSTYESRDMLLERIRRQKQTIKELIAERDSLKGKLDTMSLYRTEAAMLRERLRGAGISADLMDIVRRFREAVRDERTGDFIGGANRRRILADVDDAAVIAISAIESRGGRDTEKEKQ